MQAPLKKPTKEQVRRYIEWRIQSRTAPPSNAEIRRRLGWHLIRG